MEEVILKVLPLIGIIIVFSIEAFFFRYGTNTKDRAQEIKRFGADMKDFHHQGFYIGQANLRFCRRVL